MKNRTRRDFLKKIISAIVAAPALPSVVVAIPVLQGGLSVLPGWHDLGGDRWTFVQPIEGAWVHVPHMATDAMVDQFAALFCVPARTPHASSDDPGHLTARASILGQRRGQTALSYKGDRSLDTYASVAVS